MMILMVFGHIHERCCDNFLVFLSQRRKWTYRSLPCGCISLSFLRRKAVSFHSLHLWEYCCVLSAVIGIQYSKHARRKVRGRTTRQNACFLRHRLLFPKKFHFQSLLAHTQQSRYSHNIHYHHNIQNTLIHTLLKKYFFWRAIIEMACNYYCNYFIIAINCNSNIIAPTSEEDHGGVGGICFIVAWVVMILWKRQRHNSSSSSSSRSHRPRQQGKTIIPSNRSPGRPHPSHQSKSNNSS